jgi:hypothetical protein
MLRERAGAEGPTRASAGVSKAARCAGTRDGATPWGSPLPWPPSLEQRGRQLERVDSGCARFSTTPTGGGPRAGACFAACVGSPRCSHIERTPAGAVTYANTARLPPQLALAPRSHRIVSRRVLTEVEVGARLSGGIDQKRMPWVESISLYWSLTMRRARQLLPTRPSPTSTILALTSWTVGDGAEAPSRAWMLSSQSRTEWPRAPTLARTCCVGEEGVVVITPPLEPMDEGLEAIPDRRHLLALVRQVLSEYFGDIEPLSRPQAPPLEGAFPEVVLAGYGQQVRI